MSYSICFPVWLISLTIIPPSPSMLLQMVTFILFWQSAIPLCVDRYVPPPHGPSSLPTWVASCLGCCDWRCCEHWGAYIFSCSWAGFFWIHAQEKIAESCCCCCCFEKPPYCFPQWLHRDDSPRKYHKLSKNRPEFKSRLPMFPWSDERVSHLNSETRFLLSPKLRPLQCLTGLRWGRK